MNQIKHKNIQVYILWQTRSVENIRKARPSSRPLLCVFRRAFATMIDHAEVESPLLPFSLEKRKKQPWATKLSQNTTEKTKTP
jgi:hypothetical protein